MKAWTIRELNYLRDNASSMTIAQLAEQLGRTTKQTASTMKRHGIRTGRDGRFAPGSVPANKGTKGLKGANSTSFVKGQLPHNTKQDGDITIRTDKRGVQYQHIRLANRKWAYLHRVNWEAANGPIPEGHILVCMDGDTLNVEPTNWMPITRAEHVRRNDNRAKASETMRANWERVRRLESVGITPTSTKLRTKRKQKQTPVVPAQVDAEQLKIAGGYFNRY